MWQHLLEQLIAGDVKALSRIISLVENQLPGYEQLLEQLPVNSAAKIIGITGPPGAGKSTLTDALTGSFMHDKKKVGILCIDPSSPFNLGALLGDRIRMSEWYTNANVFIRSLATRGSLGGLSPKIIEITDVMKAALFDYIIIETVGVGQSEVEIAGLADVTVVVLVPESGDEVQTMKAGLMEIANIFVVNKSDRAGADTFVKSLLMMLAPAFKNSANKIPVLKTTAVDKQGIEELKEKILQQVTLVDPERKYALLAEKAFSLIQNKKMEGISKKMLKEEIKKSEPGKFNLYSFVKTLA